MSTERRDYLPALRFRALTRVYDPLVRFTTREGLFKRLLIEQAAPAPGQRVLDLGCGTGTLAIEVKRREPAAEVVGLDADPEMLAQARRKAEEVGVELELTEGFSTELPYEDGSSSSTTWTRTPSARRCGRSPGSSAAAASSTSPTGVEPPIR
jgi:ubiquinone/menaquinone biosynthesis C-methylase UbiE